MMSMLSGLGWQVETRDSALTDARSWHDVAFFLVVSNGSAMGVQVWYVNNLGELAVASGAKLRKAES